MNEVSFIVELAPLIIVSHSLSSQIIQGIQVIKMYAWEKPFGKVVQYARMREINMIRFVSWIRGILLSFIMFSSRVSIFTSLAMYALLGNLLTAETAFVITAFYNVLRQTMTVFFPQAIGFVAETIVSVHRLEKFMLFDELDREFQNVAKKSEDKVEEDDGDDDSEEEKKVAPSVLQQPGISLEKICSKWKGESSNLTLSNVDLLVQPATKVAVIGKVGSGKSSLLQVILGELPAVSGKIEVNGKISYAAQEPWLFSATVRQNITFGLPMDKIRYRAVVKVCSLTRDFELWPDRDKTIVGERGTSLSGGQKARINLARAVYRKADIYLLDDPLSAVDAHVARHLFENCIKGFLKEKIVILATHQLQFLPSLDQIILLDRGVVQVTGAFDSMRDTGFDLGKVLKEIAQEKAENDETKKSMNRSISKDRHNSISSTTSHESKDIDEEKDDPQVAEEKRNEGSIGWSLYNEYINASGGYAIFMFVIFMFILAQLSASAGDYFLTYWVAREEERHDNPQNVQLNETIEVSFSDIIHSDDTFYAKIKQLVEKVMYSRNIDIYVFTALTIATVALTLSRSFMFFNIAMRASRSLHDKMFAGITNATMFFFNTNPSGRILNRFSKDLGQIDEILPMTIVDVLQIFLALAGIVVVVGVVNPYTLIPTLFIAVLFYYLRRFYLMSSRNIKRMDAISK